ncbi:MAG: metallophosphoesterase [Megasphaera elsdenii]|nr:metallophosphoesterase [Megasphaera elsdenii]
MRPGSCTERIIHFARYTQTFGPLYYAGEQGGYLLVFLSPDTVTGGAAVELSHQQLAWLDQTLAAHRQQPTIIFCHAPLEQTAVSRRPGISLPSPRNSVQPAADIRTILARHHQVRLWVSGHTHTMPSDATFMDDANYYEGRVLNVYNSDWDEDTIYTNSLYLYEDHILVQTYDHSQGTWIPAFDRTVVLPEWCCLTA